MFHSSKKTPKLSKAALETLSIVAYHQPSTKNEIDTLRGVDSGAVLRSLLEYHLIEVQGRKSGTGTAMVYGTTSYFLSLFNLRDLSDLPRMRDVQELQNSKEFSFEWEPSVVKRIPLEWGPFVFKRIRPMTVYSVPFVFKWALH